MKVYYDEYALIHTYKRHHIEKHQIEEALSSGIEKMVYDEIHNSYIIFTISKLAVVITNKHHLKSAFYPKAHYKYNKIRLGKIIKGGKQHDKSLVHR